MFRQILYTQWTWTRVAVLLGAPLAFALPVLSVQPFYVEQPGAFDVGFMLGAVEATGRWFGLAALGLGLLVSTMAWSADHRGGHVCALTLPIPRWRYVVLRYAAGLVLLLPALLALWLGATIATAVTTIPEGLRAYPHALALRFGLATCVAYSIFFAISAGTVRTAGYVLATVGAVIALQLLGGFFGIDVSVVGQAYDRFVAWPGPFEIFTGRWMLIDV